eukprot:m.124730 g.124730  ORF g.124730 m.124730 type:complete len:213 (-) comp14655_c1_seq1:31-669(-)
MMDEKLESLLCEVGAVEGFCFQMLGPNAPAGAGAGAGLGAGMALFMNLTQEDPLNAFDALVGGGSDGGNGESFFSAHLSPPHGDTQDGSSPSATTLPGHAQPSDLNPTQSPQPGKEFGLPWISDASLADSLKPFAQDHPHAHEQHQQQQCQQQQQQQQYQQQQQQQQPILLPHPIHGHYAAVPMVTAAAGPDGMMTQPVFAPAATIVATRFS